MSTKALYLKAMYNYTAQAYVKDIIEQDGLYNVILDQTIFYLQGGGQPSDKGSMQSDKGIFEVQSVFWVEDTIYHKGLFLQGAFTRGDNVTLSVNKDLRVLHNRNHTAGHILDYALQNLGYMLKPIKGYHFPQGPYVEYEGVLGQAQREQLQNNLETEVNKLIAAAYPVTIAWLDNDPEKRVMVIDQYQPILCGGTHVHNLQDIGHVTIRKIKNEKGNLRISYAVSTLQNEQNYNKN